MESIVNKIYKGAKRDFSWLKQKKLKVYNLGCGNQAYDGTIGVDSLSGRSAKIVHNLNNAPWPIPDNDADIIVSFQTFEHLDDLVSVMGEVHRILKPGGRLVVEVPYFRHVGAFQDPTHKHFFTVATMEYFCRTKKRGPTYTNFEFSQKAFWYGWPSSGSLVARIFKKFAHSHSAFYDKILSILLPVKIIVYELEVIK